MNRFRGWVVIATAIAICICLTFCMVPQTIAKKASAGHCHEQKEKSKDTAVSCCSDQAFLTAAPLFSFPNPHTECELHSGPRSSSVGVALFPTQNFLFPASSHEESTAVLRI